MRVRTLRLVSRANHCSTRSADGTPTGMPLAAVTAATCLSAGFASIFMGAVARYPLAMAPGMGLNAYFTYAVVLGMGVPWQTALGAVFVSGAHFSC